jgi:hypothetical protein
LQKVWNKCGTHKSLFSIRLIRFEKQRICKEVLDTSG